MDDPAIARVRAGRDRPATDLDRVRRGVWIAVLLAHVAGGVLVDRLMRARPPMAPAPERVFEVRFIDADPAAPTAPEVLPTAAAASRPAAPQRTRVEAGQGVAVQFLPADPGAPEPPVLDSRRLFDPDGRVQLPEGMVVREAPQARSPMDPPRRVIPYERTRFDAAWEPDGETLAQEAVRKVPPLGLILQGANRGPNCPPNSTDPRCEAMVQAQRAYIPPIPQSAKQPW